MQNKKLYNLIPKHKSDFSTISDLMAINEDDMKIILPDLIKWIADYNWPIARWMILVLARFPDSIVPIIKTVLDPSAKDGILKYWVIMFLIPELPLSHQKSLKQNILRIINEPTEIEIYEEVVEKAAERLKILEIWE